MTSGRASKAERRKLQEMAAIAGDLNHLMQAGMLVGGFTCEPVIIRTQIGPTPGATVTFVMQDGSEHGPIIMEPVGIVNLATRLLAAVASLPVGAAATAELTVEPDGDDEATGPDEAVTETVTASGLVLPGGP